MESDSNPQVYLLLVQLRKKWDIVGLLQSRIIPFVPWFSLLLLIKNRVEGVDVKPWIEA